MMNTKIATRNNKKINVKNYMMKFEKILAENMLRFGTKNLGEAVAIIKKLMEAVGDPAGTITITPEQQTILDTAIKSSTALKNGMVTIKNVLTTNKVNPLYVLCAGAMNGNLGGGLSALFSRREAGSDKLILQAIDSAESAAYNFSVDVAEIQLSSAANGTINIKNYPGTTYTVDEFLTYLNTYNLANWFNSKNWKSGVEQYVIDAENILDDNGVQTLTNTMETNTSVFLYRYKGGKSTGFSSTFVPQPGAYQSVPVDIEGINVAANIETPVSIIVNDFLKNPLLKGWTISKIINQTGVNGNISLADYNENLESFKTATGLSDADLKVPNDQSEISDDNNILKPDFIWPTANTQQTVSIKFKGSKGGPADASYGYYGGLGLIAIKRAANIEAALKAVPEFANVPIETKPYVTGTDYPKLGPTGTIFFSIKGPNGETALTKELIDQVAAQKQSKATIERLASDNTATTMFSKFTDDSYQKSTTNVQ